MSSQNDDSLDSLQEHINNVEKRCQELYETQRRLEAHFASLETREKLPKWAEAAEEISNTNEFKQALCRRYNKLSSLVDIAELIAEVSLPADLPIAVTALVAIKVSRIGVERYCSEIE